MSYKLWRRNGWTEEELKDIEGMPESLGFPDEERKENGDLHVFLQRQPDHFVVLGKFKEVWDGAYYVADRTKGGWATEHWTTHHNHLLLAVTRVHEIIEAYNQRTTRA